MRDLLIRGVARPLYTAQRRVRQSTRPAILARDRGLRFRRQARNWPSARKTEWILARLRVVLRQAAAAPFYRDWFHEAGFDPMADFSFDDFARLPVLEREIVRSEADRLKMPGLSVGQVRKDATGGSTGQPTEVFKGPEERGWGESANDYFMSQIGCPPGARRGLLWGHHLDPVASDHWKDRLRTLVSNARWYDCLRVSDERLVKYHRDLQAWRPDCIIAYAGALAPLAEVAAAHGGRPTYPGRCFVTGAEKLMAQDRERIQEVFGRPIHERYGSRDAGLMGFQTGAPEDPGFEVDWANVLVEPLDDSSTAPILITKLHGDAMPMIRYRVGDLGRFPDGARPGYPALRLEEVLGREVDRLWLPSGQWFNALGIPHMMKDFPIRAFRLVQAEDYSITVQVVAGPGFTGRHREEILGTISANLPGLRLDLQECDAIPETASGKLRPVISHVTPPKQ